MRREPEAFNFFALNSKHKKLLSLKRTTNIFGTSLKKNYEKMLKKVYESNQFELIMIFWELNHIHTVNLL